MHIALVIESLNPLRGGRETSTAQIAIGLAERGCRVTVLTQASKWTGQGVGIWELGRRGLMRHRRVANFVADVQQAVEENRCDIVHAMLPVPGAHVYQPRGGTFPGQVQASIRRYGMVGPLRAALCEPLNLCRRTQTLLEREVFCDEKTMCLAVSEMVAEEFAVHYGRRENVRVVYNGVDIPQFDRDRWAQWRQKLRFQMGVSGDDPVFITVATNFALKGIDQAILAFSKWNDLHQGQVNGRLVVVGRDCPEAQQRFASGHDVGQKVVFVAPTPEILQWYAAADVCVLLSWYDPCSRTVLEAIRLGIPSITTVYNGAAEVLAGGAGIVVSSPKDTKAVAAAMDELCTRRGRAPRIEACRRAADGVSMDRHIEQLLSIYEEAAEKK